ncbi:ribonuclease H, partial [Trifolium pratense]
DELTYSEVESAAELMMLLQQVRLSNDSRDRRKWMPNTAGFFTVKSAYVQLPNRCALEEIDSFTANVLKSLWKNNVPSKVSIFGWRLLLEKLPTRKDLFSKGVVTNNSERSCVLCFKEEEEEDTHHVFVNCCVATQIWNYIFRWMDLSFISSLDVQHHFYQFVN